MSAQKVMIYVYDLSNGMAKQFSPMFLGKQVDGVWHTSVVVYDKEFYYSGGICWSAPKTTAFGTPVQELDFGSTEISKEDFQTYLKDIETEYTFEKYHIYDNNCNHFSNDIATFLTGKELPDDVMKQADEFRNTPMGKMVEGFQVNMNNNQNGYNLNNLNLQQNNQQYQQPQQQSQLKCPDVHLIKDSVDYIEQLTGNQKMIVDFYADWCGPCKNIKPLYNQLASQKKDQVKFCAINVDSSETKEICMSLGVQSMPTFIAFKDGEQFDKLNGANPVKLTDLVKKLMNAQLQFFRIIFI